MTHSCDDIFQDDLLCKGTCFKESRSIMICKLHRRTHLGLAGQFPIDQRDGLGLLIGLRAVCCT